MFRKKRRNDSAITTLVGESTRVHGDLEFSGGCLVDGYVKGNVKGSDESGASLHVSERGCIEGTVMVPNVLLNGTVKGDVKASARVELGSKARVVGNVQYKLIEMEIGAEVNGKLIHESEAAGGTGPSTEKAAEAPAAAETAQGASDPLSAPPAAKTV